MANQARIKSESSGHDYLIDIFKSIQSRFLAELNSHPITQTHDGDLGEATEESWMELLKRYLPNRYAVDSAKVVDYKGHVSDQIDIVIYDPQYTPALYGDKKQRYLPRESVYAIFEVKQEVTKGTLEYAGDKLASVRALECTSASVVGNGREFPGRKPFEVLGGLLATRAQWVDGLGDTFLSNLPNDESNKLDFVFTGESGVYLKRDSKLLKGDASLIQGLFQFLDILNKLGTVPSIDWSQYDKVF